MSEQPTDYGTLAPWGKVREILNLLDRAKEVLSTIYPENPTPTITLARQIMAGDLYDEQSSAANLLKLTNQYEEELKKCSTKNPRGSPAPSTAQSAAPSRPLPSSPTA